MIHQRTALKFDLFPVSGPFEKSELDRRRFESTVIFGTGIEFAVTSAEDIILAKLRWFRLGGGQSEVQWRDLEGIVRRAGPEPRP